MAVKRQFIFLPSSSLPYHGGARIKEIRGDILELAVSRKVLKWTEFENQIDQLAIGWTFSAEMRKRELTEVGRIKRLPVTVFQ